MRLINEIVFKDSRQPRRLQLYMGDLTAIPSHEHVDVLVLSAFRQNYSPTPRSLIGALDRVGLSVAELALQPDWDQRQTFACWGSAPINLPDLNFDRIVCLESGYVGGPIEIVNHLFLSLCPFIFGPPGSALSPCRYSAQGNKGFQ